MALLLQNGTFEAGSGFIIAPDGTIVTNAHVLGDALDGPTKGSRPIMVSLQDERVFEARVVSYDRYDQSSMRQKIVLL
jgi:S1-C subfamily serine protease